MIGDTYYERGKPVTLLAAWWGGADQIDHYAAGRSSAEVVLTVRWYENLGVTTAQRRASGGPRNCVIARDDGTLVCRPFRGLLTAATWQRRQRDKAAKNLSGKVTRA